MYTGFASSILGLGTDMLGITYHLIIHRIQNNLSNYQNLVSLSTKENLKNTNFKNVNQVHLGQMVLHPLHC